MSAHRVTRAFVRVHMTLVASLLIVLTLVVGPVPSTLAQADPGVVLASQFFRSITGEVTGYRLGPDAVLHAPAGDYVGPAGLAGFRQDLETTFSNPRFWTEDAAQAGELVIIAFTLTGVHTGSYHGLAAKCAPIAVPGVAVLRLNQPGGSSTSWTDGAMSQDPEMGQDPNGGLVIEQWLSYDADAIVRQIETFNQQEPDVSMSCAEQGL